MVVGGGNLVVCRACAVAASATPPVAVVSCRLCCIACLCLCPLPCPFHWHPHPPLQSFIMEGSVKERFDLKSTKVAQFLTGEYDIVAALVRASTCACALAAGH